MEEPDWAQEVPIKFDGFVIGTAYVSKDGSIIAGRIDMDNGVSQEIRDRLSSKPGSLSIRPNPS